MFICEKVLIERDTVHTAVRIVDVFYAPPGWTSETIVALHLILSVLFPDSDEGPHRVEMHIERPEGTLTKILESEPTPSGARVKGTTRGINITLHLGLKVKSLGPHWLIARVDGVEVTKCPFSLLDLPKQPDDSTPANEAPELPTLIEP